MHDAPDHTDANTLSDPRCPRRRRTSRTQLRTHDTDTGFAVLQSVRALRATHVIGHANLHFNEKEAFHAPVELHVFRCRLGHSFPSSHKPRKTKRKITEKKTRYKNQNQTTCWLCSFYLPLAVLFLCFSLGW